MDDLFLAIDECEESPCQNGGQCEDKKEGYKCICEPGYTGENCEVGTLFEYIDQNQYRKLVREIYSCPSISSNKLGSIRNQGFDRQIYEIPNQ